MTRVIGCLLIAFFSTTSFAKDLTNRLGVGYKNQFSNNLPGVAAQYYPSRDFGLAAVLGLDTAKDASKFGLMVKAMRTVFEENNLNFYMGGGAGLLSTEVSPNNNQSGFEIDALVGVESFFSGLDNLGFSFETGVGISSIASETRFRTLGTFGVTFYF